MPSYVEDALQCFEHPVPTRRQDSPYPWQRPNYGAKQQLTTPIDDAPALSAEHIMLIREVVGVLLYYARALDNTMMVALNSLAAAASDGTETLLDKLVHFLNYAASHPDAVLRYSASDMQLWVHSDTFYLSEPKARS